MPDRRSLILALVLGLLGLSAWWLYRSRELPRVSPVSQGEPDYLIEGFSVTLMDETGRPARRFLGEVLRHFPDPGENEIDAPHLILYRTNKPPWQVRAPRGWSDEEGTHLRLLGPVFIDREADADHPPVHIRTYDLSIQMDTHYARTDAPIQATSRADWLSSDTGGELWFGDGNRLHLFGRVRQQFDLP